MLFAGNHKKRLSRLARHLAVCLAVCLALAVCDIDLYPAETLPLAEVEYADDMSSLTLYLDGATASKQTKSVSRAMSVATAQAGYNFFEAVFVSGDDVARVSWEYGSPASINKVRRGVSYSHNGEDRAILFAGRKLDKTLLAVGKLLSVDGVEGTTFISANSSFVTFELHALTGGASYEAEESSFLLAKDSDSTSVPLAKDTTIINAHIGTRDFPLYRMPGGEKSLKASYLISLDNAEWDDFADNMRLSVNGLVEKREARYSVGNNNYRYVYYDYDTTTTVSMTNNKLKDKVAQSPIIFEFDTSETYFVYPWSYKNGIFTIIFEIPIYAYDNRAALEGDPPIDWTIRPAYGTYLYSIDSGITFSKPEVTDPEFKEDQEQPNDPQQSTIVGNWGGAVLIGVNADATDMVISVYAGK